MPDFVRALDPPEFTEAIALACDVDETDFQLGRTKLFCRPGKGAFLEELKERDLTEVIPLLVAKIQEWNRKKAAKATLGIAAQPVALASLFTLTTTGCGLPGELAGTLEGLAYTVIAGFVLGSLYTRVTTGLGMGAAELEAAAAEMEQLEQIGATEQKKAFSAQKAEDLANGPAGLLDAAERASLVTAAVAVVVVGFQLAVNGGLPSAVPNGGVCWS